jgi:hypothetical protein
MSFNIIDGKGGPTELGAKTTFDLFTDVLRSKTKHEN